MAESVRVTLAMPVADELVERIRGLDPCLLVTSLSLAQRRAYRGGRPIWAGYNEPAFAGEESEEEAQQKLVAILAETEVLFTNPVIPGDILTRAPRLKWVQLTNAGVDRLLDSELLRSGVKVATASGMHAVPIGEYVMGAMLAFAKGLPRAVRAQAERSWRPYWPDELHGKTVGIVGLGAIGGHVGRAAQG